MNELIEKGRDNFRIGLFTTVSTVALLAVLSGSCSAQADDRDRPTVWVELGGQLERVGGTGDRVVAPFMTVTPTPVPFSPESPLDAERPPRHSFGEEGKITFQPQGSRWVFSAALRYGRSNGNKRVDHQTNNRIAACFAPGSCGQASQSAAQFSRTTAKQSESHSILDFMAGRDVGLGMFGGNGVVSLGIRYAQFQAKSNVSIYARPDVHGYNAFSTTVGGYPYFPAKSFHEYTLFAHSTRSFHGIGPSVSWNATSHLAGNAESTEFVFDWGLNAAVLFGRQKAITHHQTTAQDFHFLVPPKYSPLYPVRVGDRNESRSVTVPNVGGVVAISVKFPNAKVSLGYRGDFFFGAMDTGIDARKTGVIGFHGPFATVSIGLGG